MEKVQQQAPDRIRCSPILILYTPMYSSYRELQTSIPFFLWLNTAKVAVLTGSLWPRWHRLKENGEVKFLSSWTFLTSNTFYRVKQGHPKDHKVKYMPEPLFRGPFRQFSYKHSATCVIQSSRPHILSTCDWGSYSHSRAGREPPLQPTSSPQTGPTQCCIPLSTRNGKERLESQREMERKNRGQGWNTSRTIQAPWWSNFLWAHALN